MKDSKGQAGVSASGDQVGAAKGDLAETGLTITTTPEGIESAADALADMLDLTHGVAARAVRCVVQALRQDRPSPSRS